MFVGLTSVPVLGLDKGLLESGQWASGWALSWPETCRVTTTSTTSVNVDHKELPLKPEVLPGGRASAIQERQLMLMF